ncbi:aminotransferase class V-fold PLP-dependent enzyme [Sediminibacterium sp.]|uniref:aminotransferase class V-fold PLP-dependent enzyme n=1 Tax=Sediminibacterium sp. TaxID=1917865 RepID=UPI0025F90912|nr:aminotransferase class V-fold PLP-dependent enzyme [Sediminibacterium sp.]MBW0177402.1 aminotransferase class V-fold PLP-dependent enzyme [Sediminibacterium sp.]
MHKRDFLKSISLAGLALPLSSNAMNEWIQQYDTLSPEEMANDENFWSVIRNGYKLKPDYINLENGYYNFLPENILEAYIKNIREVNYQGPYYMRTVQGDNKKKANTALAELAGCSAEELIITRNTTESLDTIIGGYPWKAGDEAVMAAQDYGAMLDMFKLVAKRHGVINKIISIPHNPKSDDELVQLYANAITPQTKLLMVCHVVNITGQVMPVKKICDMAHSKGVQVLVDGAHAFAQLNFKIPDLHCDYYGASLHKWLSVPLGAGLLYVKKEHIHQNWPLLGPSEGEEKTIARLNHTGTHPVATDITIPYAIEHYKMIGAERKEARLKYLQQYWLKQVKQLPNIIINTPDDPQRCCAIANVGVKGMKPSDLATKLLNQYKIYTVAIERAEANVYGCRITPNLYTTTEELDQLVTALKNI